jgi:hypothetical protein
MGSKLLCAPSSPKLGEKQGLAELLSKDGARGWRERTGVRVRARATEHFGAAVGGGGRALPASTPVVNPPRTSFGCCGMAEKIWKHSCCSEWQRVTERVAVRAAIL